MSDKKKEKILLIDLYSQIIKCIVGQEEDVRKNAAYYNMEKNIIGLLIVAFEHIKEPCTKYILKTIREGKEIELESTNFHTMLEGLVKNISIRDINEYLIKEGMSDISTEHINLTECCESALTEVYFASIEYLNQNTNVLELKKDIKKNVAELHAKDEDKDYFLLADEKGKVYISSYDLKKQDKKEDLTIDIRSVSKREGKYSFINEETKKKFKMIKDNLQKIDEFIKKSPMNVKIVYENDINGLYEIKSSLDLLEKAVFYKTNFLSLSDENKQVFTMRYLEILTSENFISLDTHNKLDYDYGMCVLNGFLALEESFRNILEKYDNIIVKDKEYKVFEIDVLKRNINKSSKFLGNFEEIDMYISDKIIEYWNVTKGNDVLPAILNEENVYEFYDKKSFINACAIVCNMDSNLSEQEIIEYIFQNNEDKAVASLTGSIVRMYEEDMENKIE